MEIKNGDVVFVKATVEACFEGLKSGKRYRLVVANGDTINKIWVDENELVRPYSCASSDEEPETQRYEA